MGKGPSAGFGEQEQHDQETQVSTIGKEPRLTVDVTAVGHSDVRARLLREIVGLGFACRDTHTFWSAFVGRLPRRAHPTLVCGDLAQIVRQYRSSNRHRWVGTIRRHRPYFIVLVRTKADERCADLVDDLMRSSDLRMTVCRDVGTDLTACLSGAIRSLNPNALLDVRYSSDRQRLWLQFGDGLCGFVTAQSLSIDKELDRLDMQTATIGERGATIEVLDRAGHIFEIDAEAARAAIDEDFAEMLVIQQRIVERTVAQRLRAARKNKRLTQVELSELTGLDQAVISKLERGLHQPRVDTLERIATGLNLSLSELIATD